MSNAGFAAVTYVGLPISSGGAHSLRRMSSRVALDRTITFLDTCTEPVDSIRYYFQVCDVPDLPRQRHLEAELEHRFGKGRRVPVTADRTPEALELLNAIHPQPTNQWGMAPVWFRAESNFRILDPTTQRALPGQHTEQFASKEYEWRVPLGTSCLSLILNNSAHLGINLCIPDADEELLERVVPWLQDHLPFKMSPKQWRSWTPTQSGSFKSRRLSAPKSAV